VYSQSGRSTFGSLQLQVSFNDVSRMRYHGSQTAGRQAAWEQHQWVRFGVYQAVWPQNIKSKLNQIGHY